MLGGIALALVAVALVWRQEFRGAVDVIVLGVREAGPLAFFLAMAVLPAAGFPLLAFTLAAGPVFAPSLGAGVVIACSLAAVTANLLLTYWLSQRALRPFATRLLARFGYDLPVGVSSPWELTLIVRLLPGPPFWAQSYLLGLLRIPLLPYLAVSAGVLAGFIVALVLGGQALMQGNGMMALRAAAVVGVVAAVLQLVRRHLARRKASPTPSVP